MAIVGIIFTLLLRTEDLGALLPWANFVLHDLMPCVVVIDWLLDPPAARLSPRLLPRFFIFPAVYLAYTLIRGSQVAWYPYPFLNPAKTGGHVAVTLYALGITALFVLIAWILLAAGNRLRTQP
jgi:hypothetical protein